MELMADSPTTDATTDAPATAPAAAAPPATASTSATAPAPASAPAPAALAPKATPASAAPGKGDGGKGDGDAPAADTQASEARIRELESQLRDLKSQAGRAKTVEERLASVESELAQSKADGAALRAETRRTAAVKEILAKVPASRQPEAEPMVVGLASLHGIDLSAEDRDATVKAVHDLLELRHPALLKDQQPVDPFPHLPKAPNAAPPQRGAHATVQGLGTNGKTSRLF